MLPYDKPADGLVVQVPWDTPPEEAFWFDYITDAQVAAGATVTLISFNIPSASRGVIKWFGQDVCIPGTASSVIWKITINGGPDRTYGSIVGLISTIQDPTETLMLLKRSSEIKLIVENTGSVAFNIIGRLKGWHWPERG